MKVLIFLQLTLCVIVFAQDLKDHWKIFKSLENKTYRSVAEEKFRYMVFAENFKIIQEHNNLFDKGFKTFNMTLNQFADISREEFLAILNTSKYDSNNLGSGEQYIFNNNENVPEEMDWREKGAVTGIKNQGSCGSCWSFSTTGSLEGQYQIKNGKLISLSEQNLVDCSGSYGNEGCNGGLMTYAFNYIKDHGINPEEKYPYEGRNSKCRFSEKDNVVKVNGFTEITSKNENDLQNAVGSIGPVSVAIDATNLQFYSSGLFDDAKCSQDKLNHGVLAVGYGKVDQGEFWIVKNSWGTNWGEAGYIRMSRNKDNQCGIATAACYPNI